MKILFFVLAIVLSPTSFAATGLRIFEVHETQFDPALNLDPTRQAQVNVDYDAKTVSLFAHHLMWKCTPGAMCMQLVPAPFATHLKILTVKTDACGLRTVTAVKDGRSTNGSYERIRLLDASDATCLFLVEVVQKAVYHTSHPSYDESEKIVTESRMRLKLLSRTESWDDFNP